MSYPLIACEYSGMLRSKVSQLTSFEHWLPKQLPAKMARDIGTSMNSRKLEYQKTLEYLDSALAVGIYLRPYLVKNRPIFGTYICFYGTNIDPSRGNTSRAAVLFVCRDNDSSSVSTLHQIEESIPSS